MQMYATGATTTPVALDLSQQTKNKHCLLSCEGFGFLCFVSSTPCYFSRLCEQFYLFISDLCAYQL